jgi:hypothetical protein
VDDVDQGGFRLLPGGADLRAAVRRTLRVGPTAGELIEDFGVEPDVRYAMSRRDILHNNEDLIARAIDELQRSPVHRLSVTRAEQRLEVEAPGATLLEVTSMQRPIGTFDLDASGRAVLGLPLSGVQSGTIELVAYAGGRPVARVRTAV